jgi:hypothetical protein
MSILEAARIIAERLADKDWAASRRPGLRKRGLKRWATTRTEDFRDLYRVTLQNAVPIHLPMVLISQIQRSGGTLLAQLFDGHPQCYAYAYELYIGFPNKTVWPVLDLNDSPDRWFLTLFETPVSRAFRRGYQKVSPGSGQDGERFLFIFLPSLQREIFLHYCRTTNIASQRDVFDAYMTSYFNAWLNNRAPFGKKKVITSFVERVSISAENVQRFFEVYPDGKLLSIVRDPWGWYDSARRHNPSVFGDVERAMVLWKESAESMIRNKRHYGERVRIIRYEELIANTQRVMSALSDYVGIGYDEVLLQPTFNTMPIKADSSYPVNEYGILTEPLVRYRQNLAPGDQRKIEELARQTYESVIELS